MKLARAWLAVPFLSTLVAAGCVDTSVADEGATDDAVGGGGGADGPSDDGGAQAPEGLSCGQLATPERVVMGYFPTWTGRFEETVAQLDWEHLTHIAIAFANPVGTADELVFQGDEANMQSLIETAHQNGVKVLVSIAGASDSALFREHIAPERVDGMVTAVAAFVETYGLDGVDVDIEGSAVDETYGPFVQKLAAAIRPEGKLVTAAVARNSWDRINDATMWCFDFLNLMTYDYAGTWSDPSEHSTLAQARQDLSYWVGRDYPASRTVLGMPFYGYCWGASCEHGYTSFGEIAEKYPDQTAVDWITGDGYQISLNGTKTITKKTQLAAADYGGVMVWELTLDSADGLLWDALVAGL
ncbi:MAG TPA: glycosyl hydrolase family 18 protein [Polyangiaceae bacterium]|nr:glycosyl hydrolase family 18 protein [Polyangiaceae bacterium]